MTPFAIEVVWHAGRPVACVEPRSTLALLIAATVQRTTAATVSTGTPCCRCAIPIRRTSDLHCITIAASCSEADQFRVLARAYCTDCAPHDTDTAEAMATAEHGGIALRFRVTVPPSTAYKPKRSPAQETNQCQP